MDIIEEAYQMHCKGVNLRRVRDHYNKKRGYFEHHFKKRGLKTYAFGQYIVNNNYFKDLDSEISCYLLGFFYADGCINRDGRISIRIQEQDGYILNWYQKEICPEAIVKRIDCQIGAKVRQPQNSWRINSPEIIKTLKEYKLSECKTFKEMYLPPIEAKLMNHFIRGFFDGDGHVRKDRAEASIVCATKNLFIEMSEQLARYGIETSTHIQKMPNGTILYRIAWYGDNFRKFTSYLYKNANYFLKRKKMRFDKLQKEYRDKHGN